MAEIDREALLHDIEQSVVYTARGKITSAEMRGARKIIERIKCAPAVEPIYIHEPTKSEFKRMAAQMGYAPVRYGLWEGTADGYADGELVYDMWACSECGFDADGAEEKPEWKYCPYCGAKMDGDIDE